MSDSSSDIPLKTLVTKRFNILGWSTTTLNDICPDLSVDWYVYIGSGLPKKTLLSHLALFCSDTLISYGGNHITLPPLGPLSQNGKSVYVKPGSVDVFHAKFSSENIYFFAM